VLWLKGGYQSGSLRLSISFRRLTSNVEMCTAGFPTRKSGSPV